MNREKKQHSRNGLKAVILIGCILVCLSAAAIWRENTLCTAQKNFVSQLEEEDGNYNENRVVLSATTHKEAMEMAEAFGGTLRITESGNFAVITLPEGMTLSDIAENKDYRKYHDRILLDYNNFGVREEEIISEETTEEETIEKAEIRANYQVNDPMYPQQGYLDYLNIGNSWEVSRGADTDGEKVKIAVIDTGIDTDHPEFYDADGNSIISTKSYNSTNDKTVEQNDISVIEDTNGHGTAVAGVIAAQMNDKGVAGIAPDAELLIIKCDADSEGQFKSSADIVFAIYYAIEQDVDVINMSLGGAGSKALEDALQLAVDSNIIPVASAGNDGTAVAHYPAAYSTTIGVGALEESSWEIAGYSNYGINSDIMAPGTALTTVIGGGYSYENGTSIACPMVTAAVAIYRVQNPYADYESIKENLLAAGRDLGTPGEDFFYGYGALDMNAFICEEKGSITYDYCTQEIENTSQVFVRQHTIQTVPEPERTNIVFDDWYYDKAYTQVFDYDAWYSTEFVENVTLYAKWVNEDDEDASVYNYSTLSDGTIEIVSYKGKRRYLTVPDSIDGKVVSSIGRNAFSGNSRLKEIILPEGLVSIKEKAFNSVNNLRKVTFKGAKLKTIEQYAFYNCSSLRELSLPDSLQTIGEFAFCGCSSLLEVNISENSELKKIGNRAFSGTAISSFYIPRDVVADGFDGSVLAYCKNMRSVSVHADNSVFVVSNHAVYNLDRTNLIYYPAGLTGSYSIPDGVITVGVYAFTSSSVSEIELNSVELIDSFAFASAGKLTSVVLPETLTALGESAFEASAVSHVTLSGNLDTIPKSAFAKTKLISVHIGSKVQSICASAFADCASLKTLTFAENAELKSIEGGIRSGAFFGCRSLTDFVLPDSLTSIGKYAFFGCSSITNLSIPVNISSIGENAFEYCTRLQKVNFADNCILTKIPDYAFGKCTALTEVGFSDKITVLGKYAFSNCTLLSVLDFSESSMLTTVEDYCFCGSRNLKTMQLPDSVSIIGEFAFVFGGLQKAEISASVSSIGKAAFGGCYSLKEVIVDENNGVYASVENVLFDKEIVTVYCVPASRMGSYILPESVQSIAPYSFYYDKLLTLVAFPKGLQDIQENAFYSCENLQSIDIPASVNTIGRKAFENCYKMASVTFGEGSKLQRLGIYTFVNCGFSEITIPASVEEMAQYVFYNCSSLKRITFEKNSRLAYVAGYMFSGTRVESIVFEEGSALTSLQAHAFDGASYLKSVDFGDAQLTNVDNYAFYNCAQLESISLPETVTYIGRYAFYGCQLLDRMDIPATVEFIGQSAFYGTANIKLFFAAESLPVHAETDWDKGVAGYFLNAVDYIVTDEWEYSVTRNNTISLVRYKGAAAELTIDTVDGYTVEKIGARCFYDNDTLTGVTLSKNIKEIGNYAFAGCDNLTALTVPASVERIGKYAFADSASVVSIADGSCLKTIDAYAFSGNSTAALTLPDSVTQIGEGAFYGSGLTTLTIGESSGLKSIGAQAFEGSGIASVYLPASLEKVGVEAFKDVFTLSNITIAGGNTALMLSNSAFEGIGILEITIPARVYYIGEYTFGSCLNLLNIDVDSENASYTSLDGVLCDVYGTTLIQYPSGRSGAYQVPEQFTVLTYGSFKNAKKLTEVTFATGSAVKTIGWQTFSGCESLTKITVPDTVVSFDFYAFENCTSLTDVVLGEGTQLTDVGEGAFYGCTALTNISLPDAVVEIGDYAFYNCVSLTTFPLPENAQVKGIYDYAFYGCTGIARIPDFPQLVEIGEYAFACTSITEYTVPAAVKDIASNVFAGCESLTTVYCDENNEDYTAISGALYEKGATSATDYDALVVWPNGKVLIIGEGKTEITSKDTAILKKMPEVQWMIADGVTSIGENAFYQYTGIVKAIIPEGVTSIGNSAFAYCTSLTSVTIPEGVTSIGDNVFQNCSGLTNVTIPGSVSSISTHAFSNCTGLESVTILHGVESIQSYAFDNCINLTKVVIPETITDINHYSKYTAPAFRGCRGLTSAGPIGKGYNIEFGWTESIPSYAFYECTSLTNVMIPDGVTSICSYAFDNCSNLISVTIPDSLTSIGEYAFYYCSDLVDVMIPDGVTGIGERAFQSCSSLTSITIPGSVTSIGQYALSGCKGLTSAGPIGGGYDYEFGWTESIPSYAFYNCSGLTSITIPGTVASFGGSVFSGCKGLTSAGPIGGGYDYEFGWTESIPSYAFNGCSGLTSITIPGSVTSIGKYALFGCRGLTSAGPIGGGYDYEFGWTESIPSYAFYNCSGLTSITIPEGVTSIGVEAFQNCSSLTSITIPGSVTSIDSYAFENCTKLTSAGPIGGGYDYEFGWTESIPAYAFRNCSGLTSVMIPEGVTSIGRLAFRGCSGLTSAGPIGGGYDYEFGWTESIPAYAFDGCSGLTSITIPEGVTTIGYDAFYDCKKLNSITIPASVTSMNMNVFYNCSSLTSAGPIGGGYNIEFGWTESIPNYAFYGHNRLTSVTIPEGVTSIGSSAFYNCSSLTDIILPSSVEKIGGNAFYYCENLLKIGFLGDAPSVGSSAFERNVVLFYLEGKNNWTTPEWNGYTTAIWDGVTMAETFGWSFEDGVLTIRGTRMPEWDSATSVPWYSQRKNIESVVIQDGMSNIERYAFFQCTSLTRVTIPGSVTTIAYNTFSDCSGLTSAGPIGGGYSYEFGWTESIPENAFYTCTDLTDVVIPEGIASIGRCAFYNCTSLASVMFPDSVTSIAPYAFEDCTSLTGILIPDSLTSIGSGAFADCISLTSVTIPGTVTNFSGGPFSGCTGLTSAGPIGGGYSYEFGWTEAIPAYAFSLCKSLTNITIPDSVTSIGSYAFQYCTGLTSITIPSGVTGIDSGAFSGCTGLTGITIPGGVTSIGNSAFQNCTGLTGITIPDSVTSIGIKLFFGCTGLTSAGPIGGGYNIEFSWADAIPANAFCNCTSLTRVTIPEGMTRIGNKSFSGCTSLTRVTIPESVTIMGNEAFSGCSGLTNAGPIGWEYNYEFGWADVIPTRAFNNLTSLTRVTIPEGVTSIGNSAFQNCTGLTSITIPTSMIRIDGYAFYNCSGLTGITIPEGVTSVGDYAFYNCSGLTSITIPESMISFEGSKAFSGCSKLCLVQINSPKVAKEVTFVSSCGYLCKYASTVLIPSALTDIGSYITSNFTQTEESTVDGENYTAYSNHAHDWQLKSSSDYMECRQDGNAVYACVVCGLEKSEFIPAHDLSDWIITKEATCTENGEQSRKCSRCDYCETRSVEAAGHNYEDSVKESTCTEQGYTAHICSVCGDSYEDNYTEPLGHTYVEGVCTGCGKEEKITGSCGENLIWALDDEGILTISGNGAMKNYSSSGSVSWNKYTGQIKNVVLERGVTTIGDFAFYGLKEITEITIPKGVTIIGNYAFKTCSKLENVSLPNTLWKIGESAFFGCTSLKEMNMPDSVTVMGAYAFKECTGMNSLYISAGLVGINESMFYGCSSLTDVVIPEGIRRIDGYVFKNCSGLASVSLPSTLVKLGESAFYGCTSLQSITLPDGVTAIRSYTFKNCTALKEVSLSETLTSIGEAAFYGCTKLDAIVLPDTVVDINGYAFKNCVSLRTIQMSANLTQIGESAFYGCEALEGVIIPDKVTGIGDYSFRKCKALKDIQFSTSLSSIGESSFYGCEALTNLVIPEGVSRIGSYAFKGCIGLTEVNLPDSLSSIGESAFYGCTVLGEIVIPCNVNSIAGYAFSRCTGLNSIEFTGDAPVIQDYVFYKVVSDVYYPAENNTWTENAMQNYGGTLTWFQKNDAEMLSEEISEGNEILSTEGKEDAVESGVSDIDTANSETKELKHH